MMNTIRWYYYVTVKYWIYWAN